LIDVQGHTVSLVFETDVLRFILFILSLRLLLELQVPLGIFFRRCYYSRVFYHLLMDPGWSAQYKHTIPRLEVSVNIGNFKGDLTIFPRANTTIRWNDNKLFSCWINHIDFNFLGGAPVLDIQEIAGGVTRRHYTVFNKDADFRLGGIGYLRVGPDR
jgi:hypothetical protein